MIQQVTGEELIQLVESGKPLVVDFFSPTCGPCKLMHFVMEDLAKTMDTVQFVKLDIMQHRDVTEHYNVLSIPTIVIFQQGVEQQRLKGVQQKAAIAAAIQRITKLS